MDQDGDESLCQRIESALTPSPFPMCGELEENLLRGLVCHLFWRVDIGVFEGLRDAIEAHQVLTEQRT